MTKTFAIINQKGGVGKSTTSQALAAGFSFIGYKTLLIDLDPQGNTSYTFKADTHGATALGVLIGEVTAAGAIQHTQYGDIIAGSKTLTGAENILTDTGKEYRLKEALEPIKSNYDYIVIDTPPALGILTVNALTAADSVIIPAQADLYSLQGIMDLAGTIGPIKKYCNPDLTIEGILLTRYNSRSTFAGEILDLANQIAANLNTKVFDTTIREAIAVKKAQAAQQSLYEAAAGAKVTEEYFDLVKQLVKE